MGVHPPAASRDATDAPERRTGRWRIVPPVPTTVNKFFTVDSMQLGKLAEARVRG